jgi:transketolase
MKCKDIQVLNEKETRGGSGEGACEIGKENENVVILTVVPADSIKIASFIGK